MKISRSSLLRLTPLVLLAACRSMGGASAVGATDLAGHWTVAGFVSPAGDPTPAPSTVEAYLDLELTPGTAGGTASGKAGVNRFSTTWEVRAGRLVMKPAALTKMAGPPESMEFESRLMKMLGEPLHPHRNGDGIRLSGTEGSVQLAR